MRTQGEQVSCQAAIRLLQLINRAREAGNIDEAIRNGSVENRLPTLKTRSRTAVRLWLPIALKVPLFHQSAVLPPKGPLIPNLRSPIIGSAGIRPARPRWLARHINSGFVFDEDVISVN